MATGQLDPAASSRFAFALPGVPVLLYHGLASSDQAPVRSREGKYWVALPQFQEVFRQIQQASRRVALLREMWTSSDALDGEKLPVAVTFDDGRRSDYDVALPALLEAGVRADFFVNTNTVGRPGYLNWQQIFEMHRTGMAFHSHSRDHIDLSRLSVRELEAQLGESKQRLEDRLGASVDFLAVPYGLTNRQVVEVARRLGYRAVCTSSGWPTLPGATTIGRVAIYRHTTPRDFQRLLAGDPLWYLARAARAASLYLPKRILLRYRPAQLGVSVLEEQG